MDGSKKPGAADFPRKSERLFLRTPGTLPPQPTSSGRTVKKAKAVRHIPRDPRFRPEDMKTPFRYRTAKLPDYNQVLADENKLGAGDRKNLEALESVLRDPRERTPLIAHLGPLHNWLVMSCRKMEADLETKDPKKIKKAQRLASCLDDICKQHNFDWRKRPLSLNYVSLSSKDLHLASNLFDSDQQEKDYQLNQEDLYFPPWAEVKAGGHSLAEVYNTYWEIRQRLGNKKVASPFDKNDFVTLYPGLHAWLKQFAQEATGLISQDEIDAFKYLLDECDKPANEVEGKPQWHWRDTIRMQSDPNHKVSGDIKTLVNGEIRLHDLQPEPGSDHSTVDSQGTSPDRSSDRTTTPMPGSDDAWDIDESPTSPTAQTSTKRKANTEPEGSTAKQARTEKTEAEAIPEEVRSKIRTLETIKDEWIYDSNEDATRKELLHLNPKSAISVKKTGLEEHFKEIVKSHERKDNDVKLDTYQLLNLPMECALEMLKDYGKDRGFPSQERYKGQFDALKNVLSAVGSVLNRIEKNTDDSLIEMINKKQVPSGTGEIYTEFCINIDKIKKQYQAYQTGLGEFEKLPKPSDEAYKLASRLRKLMEAPQAWVAHQLSDAEQWENIKNRKYYTPQPPKKKK